MEEKGERGLPQGKVIWYHISGLLYIYIYIIPKRFQATVIQTMNIFYYAHNPYCLTNGELYLTSNKICCAQMDI